MTQTLTISALVATISLSLSAHAQDSYSGTETDPGLTAFGNQIVDQNGNNVRLTGVNDIGESRQSSYWDAPFGFVVK